jgi:hypothetical protein
MLAKVILQFIWMPSGVTGSAVIFELVCAALALAVTAPRIGSENTHENAMAAAVRNDSTTLGAHG